MQVSYDRGPVRRRRWIEHVPNSTTVALALLGASLAARVWIAAVLDLQKDEAFYAVWAREPHPAYALLPLAAIRASCALGGETPFAVRLPFVLAMTGAGLFAFSLGRAATGSTKIAAWTAALLVGNVWAHFAGAQAHPDAFLALFWIGTLATLVPGRGEWWRILVGAALAAGAALSKYTGFLLWPAWLAVELASRRDRRARGRDLVLGTLLWAALVSPAVAGIVAERAHWLKVALHLSDLSDRLAPPIRLLLVPLAPLAHLASPSAAIFAIGPWAAWRAAGPARRACAIGFLVFLLFGALAALGSLKGNWILPALWGTLPWGVAWFTASRSRRRWLWGLTAVGIAITAGAHLAALRPDFFSAAAARVAPLAAFDRTYASGISREESRHATSRSWLDRSYEWRLSAPLADSLARRAAAGGRDPVVVSDLYEVVYAVRFYSPAAPVRLVEDARFRIQPEFAAGPGELPPRILYVSSPGTELPEPLFTWYRYLERDRALTVPLGRHGERRYDVWRCGRSEDEWSE